MRPVPGASPTAPSPLAQPFEVSCTQWYLMTLVPAPGVPGRFGAQGKVVKQMSRDSRWGGFYPRDAAPAAPERRKEDCEGSRRGKKQPSTEIVNGLWMH